MDYQDYYEILGVPHDADADAIRVAFRRLARKFHPDVSKEPDAEARMKKINEAHAVLSDAERRAAYDQIGSGARAGEPFTPPPGWGADYEFSGDGTSAQDAEGFSDFFSELFGRMGSAEGGRGGGARGTRRASSASRNHHARVLLDLEDSFGGAQRQITLRMPEYDSAGHVIYRERTLNVRIPRGVRPGQVIRLAGQGAPSADGQPAGDLLLEVEFKPHAELVVEGPDLHLTLPVTPWELALGAQVEVELPQGKISVRIPAGGQSGSQLRVRGKGLPCSPPGDLLIALKVVVPPADSPRARELYQAMASEIAFDPRPLKAH